MENLIIFGAVCITTWFLFIYFWPPMMLYVYKRAILVKGFGDGPVPINTLYTEPQALFADPLHPPASASKLATTGMNRDTLLTVGWLDLNKGPQILHVPDMAGRYYSVQFTDPLKNTSFAYVGKRTTASRGLGIGSRLVGLCIERARELGYRKLMLWTNDVLISARKIYQAAGFTLVEENPHHSFGKNLVGQIWILDLQKQGSIQ